MTSTRKFWVYLTHAFEIINAVLLAFWIVLIADYFLPKKEVIERVEAINCTERHRAGGPRGRTPDISYQKIRCKLATSNRVISAAGLLTDQKVKEGDSLKFELSPALGVIYSIGVRDTTTCCTWEFAPPSYTSKPELKVFVILGALLSIVALLPFLSMENKGAASFFAIIMLFMYLKYTYNFAY